MADFMDYPDDVRARIITGMHRITTEVARVAKQETAPEGATGQLRSGIRALKPRVVSGEVIGTIISSARSRSGFEYAGIQHDATLRHIDRQPFLRGYASVGSGKSRRAKYRDGYIKLKDSSPRFKTEYLDKAYSDRFDMAVRILEKAVEGA